MMRSGDNNDQPIDLNDVPASDFPVDCSICLESLEISRSRAKLQCGHEFHLDCIGSAFNAKGIMQCPNCRDIERGEWLYADGSALSVDENTEDEDPLVILPPSGFHICPFHGIVQAEGHSTPGNAASVYENLENIAGAMAAPPSGLPNFTIVNPNTHATMIRNDIRDGINMIQHNHQLTLNLNLGANSAEWNIVDDSVFSGHTFSSSQRPSPFTPFGQFAGNQMPNGSVFAFGGNQASSSSHPFINPHHPATVASPSPSTFSPGVRSGFPAFPPTGRPSDPTAHNPSHRSTANNLQSAESPLPNFPLPPRSSGLQ